VLKEAHTYYAFHIDPSDSLIRKFQNAFDELKTKPADGRSEYEKILDKYLK